MILWFPQHVPKEKIFKYLQQFDSKTFRQILQDKIHSRFPAFTHVKIIVDSNLQEVDSLCSICYEQGDYQLACGHIFHKHCIQTWKRHQLSCPLCRACI